MTYLTHQQLKPSPFGRGLGEGLATSQIFLEMLREMNPDRSGFISRKLLRIDWERATPHPQPFSQREKGDEFHQIHLD
jgi:hypothetical protein